MAAIASSIYKTPGVYIEEVGSGIHPIEAVGTNTVAFVGVAPDVDAFLNKPKYIENWQTFLRLYAQKLSEPRRLALALAVKGFFDNGGGRCCIVNHGLGEMTGGGLGERRGLDLLETVDDVQIICAPGHNTLKDHVAIITHCANMQDRFAILSPPQTPSDLKSLTVPAVEAAPPKPARDPKAGDSPSGGPAASTSPTASGFRPPTTDMAALYFPWVTVPNPFGGPSEVTDPCGHVAGIYARTDATRGVYKAPANEVVRGILGLDYYITAGEQGDLNQNGVNVLRMISGAPRVWGARTLAEPGADCKYVSVKRMLIMIEQSIKRGTNWVVFEPNDEPLRKSVKRDLGGFLSGLHTAGGLVGRTPQEAFFVRCSVENNPPESVDLGFLIVDVGVAIVKPAEFIIFRIGQHIDSAEKSEVANA